MTIMEVGKESNCVHLARLILSQLMTTDLTPLKHQLVIQNDHFKQGTRV